MTEAPGTTHGDLFQALGVSPGGRMRTYLAPGVKVMFQSINKNACTSLKWMMADLAGEDLSGFKVEWQQFTADAEAVHDRSQWKVSPFLGDLTPEQRAQIHPENGWFIFAVVRDPRLRVFSAWQNRLLMEHPISQQYREQWWYPRHPLTRETVLEDFAKFAELLETEPEHKLRVKDPHFRDQVELLVEDGVPYSRIYEIGEMKQLTSDLSAHLRAQGHSGELYLPRANPTPLHAVPELFAGGVKERLERVFAADFERFGHLWDFSRVEKAEPWAEHQLISCETESALGLRIAKVHALARQQRDLRIALEKQLAERDEAASRRWWSRRS
ncbi:MAG TPA: sulfotransferase family 2 domain-containing protein [Nocardioides sp.]|nr:sulfotransferase family 2 domain-containing protein [Nocardioides sp.]